jgi:hypothetical protein
MPIDEISETSEACVASGRRGRPPLRPFGLAGLVCLTFAGLASLASFTGCRDAPVALFATRPHAAPEFDDGWDSVPRQFRGDSFAALSRALGDERGEFELPSAYAARMKAVAEQKRKFAFMVDPGRDELYNFSVRYDPEAERFDIGVSVNWDSSVLLAQTESGRGAFLAPNAFGAATRIVDLAVDKYYARLANESLNMVTPKERPLYEGTLRCPPAEAPGLKGRIKMLVVAGIVPGPSGAERAYAKTFEGNPYYSREFFLADATAAQPVNLNESSHFLHVRLDSVWIYDDLTGAVLKKHRPAGDDEAVRQARQALAEGKYYTAQALVSGLSGPVAQKIRDDAEAMRLENAEDESRRLEEGRRNERLRNHGPDPDPVIVKRFVQRLVPVLIDAPSEILSISPSVRSLATIDGELRAAWQVRADVLNKRDQVVRHLYVYIRFDEILWFELL